MKKILSLTLLAVFAIAIFGGCTGPVEQESSLTDSSTTVTDTAAMEVTEDTEATTTETEATTTVETTAETTVPTETPTTAKPAATAATPATTKAPTPTNPPAPPANSAQSILNSASLNPTKTHNSELDATVQQVLNSCTTSGMSTYDKVKACYDYLVRNVEYAIFFSSYLTPDDGYVYKGIFDPLVAYNALYTLSHKTGVCDSYSAAFVALTRAIGLESYVVGGRTSKSGGGWTGHAWVNIRINGVMYVFDPQVEQNIAKNGPISYYRFCKTDEQVPNNYQYDDRDGYIAAFGGFAVVAE